MSLVSTLIGTDPNTPPGTEPLKQGPSRFHEIKSAILEIFGLSGAASSQFLTPFYFDTVNDATAATNGRLSAAAGAPITVDGLATKGYVDGKTQTLTLGTTNFLDYTAGTSVPPTFTWNPASVYTLLVAEPNPNNGPVTVQAGASAAIPLVHEDGTPLVAGDLAGSSVAGQPAGFTVIYDNSQPAVNISPRLILIGFVGGTLTQPLILKANPTAALGAVTKQYADHIAGMSAPVRTPIPGVASPPPFITSSPTPLVTVPITFPAETGTNWILMVDFFVYFHNNSPHTNALTYVWASDGTNSFAVVGRNTGGGSDNNQPTQGAGTSPVVYAQGTPINLVLNAMTAETNLNVQVPTPPVPPGVTDAGYLGYTMIRVSV